ncbi:hypothetical protein OAA60_05935 [Porticoccaceae bacterium]|nr:hypothetical protein [Porticoccaceae bacterium]
MVRLPTISLSKYLKIGQELFKEDSIPALDDPMPTLDDPIPALDDPIPALDDPIPALDDPIPALDDPIPALDDPIPALDDPIPALDDPMPTLDLSLAILFESREFSKNALKDSIIFFITSKNMILTPLPSVFLLIILTRFIRRVFCFSVDSFIFSLFSGGDH